MPNMQERLNAAVERAEVDTALLHEIVHGDIETIVTTEGGDVPSVAKAVNDIQVVVNKNSEILYLVANGDENTTVQTENGEVPTAAKAIKDISESIHSGTEDLVNMAINAAEEAKEWATKTDGAVQDLDYSAKHYAEVAGEIMSDMSKKSDTLEGYGIVDGVAYEQIQDDKIKLTILYPESLTYSVIL